MLRWLVLALLLANGGYFMWSHGMLAGLGMGPLAQAEPQRLAQQLRPEAMRLLTTAESRQFDTPAITAAAAPAAECLQAGLFTEQQAVALRARLEASLPPSSWALEPAVEPGRWIIYMGKYPSDEAMSKKRTELRQLNVSFETLPNNSVLAPGFSLGGFSSKADADAEMARVATRGVRTARVMAEKPEARGQRLKLPAADALLKTQLDALKPQLEGHPLQACS